MTDRELDARIAVEVMGLERIEYRPGYGLMYWKRIDTSHAPAGWYDEHYPVPSYSTDIGVAMGEVVKKLCQDYAFACWHVPSISSVMWGWVAGFHASVHPPTRADYINGIGSWGHDDLLPTAICLAALEAVQVKV